MVSFKSLRFLFLTTLCLPLSSWADNQDDKAPYQSVYIAPSLGYHFFENNREVRSNEFSYEDGLNLGIGLGYHFNPNWAVEVNYQETDTEFEDISQDLTVTHLHVDAFYHFNNFAKNMGFYIPFGFGEQEYEADDDDVSETSLNLGVGYRYMPFKRVYFRTDVRAVYGNDDDTIDGIANLGVVFMFATPPSEKRSSDETRDTDGDGVMNKDDQCPNTENGMAVDSQGCRLISDSDGDGVMDEDDACANTEAGATVDSQGCVVVAVPLEDQDGDGVADGKDKCQNTAEGIKVDEAGCPLKENRSFDLNVTFKNASNEVADESLKTIDQLGEIMSYHKDLNVMLLGYTDSSGPAAFNQQLSEKRAQSVKDAVVQRHNIDPSRIEVVGKGEADPIEDNSTREGRAKNRRVVAELEY